MQQDHEAQPEPPRSSEAAQERAALNAGVLDGASTSEEIVSNAADVPPPQRIGSAAAETNDDLTNHGGLGRSND